MWRENNRNKSLGCNLAAVIDHKFKVAPNELWAILGAPARVDWVPSVASCTFDGEVRSLDLLGAGAIRERILTHDNDARILEYSCFESSGQLESHWAKMEITAIDYGSRLKWQVRVKPNVIEPFIRGSMEGCIARLEEMLQ